MPEPRYPLAGRHLVDGAWVDGHGLDRVTHSPVDGAPVWIGRDASEHQALLALDSAAAAFPRWRRTDVDERRAIVRRFAEVVTEHRADLAELISTEVGKTRADADAEVGTIIGKAELSIAAHDERTGTSHRDLPAGRLEVGHRPLGPMVVLGPFNFPGHLPNGHITPALLAGNTVVFKPSEQAPAVGRRMVELWEVAGLPAGVLQLVVGGVDVAETLIDHRATAGVLFTGGVHAGRAIHRRLAGRPEVMLALELGGNNPIIAWDVDDPKAAATLIVRSAFLSSGQRCTCARRLVVSDGPDGEAIVDAVVELTSRLRIGSPRVEPEPFFGPVISPPAARRVLDAQRALVRDGARALIEARLLGDGPAYVSPAVLDVTAVADRPDDEVFGPLLQVIRVPTFDQAIDEANDTAFGLAAGVLTDRDDRWDEAFARLEAGIVNRNVATVGASGAAPFGGLGASGNHRPAGYTAADYCSDAVASLASAGPLTADPITQVIDGPG